MNDDAAKKRLGRGLAALIGEIDSPEQERAIDSDGLIAIDRISPNPNNPRQAFDETDLRELSQSLQKHGLMQPVIVRPVKNTNNFEIIAGERRWRAAHSADLTEIPVIIRDVDDLTALELAIVENVQRADLNPVEEAEGYRQLIAAHNYTQAKLAEVIGKSRSHVANTLRLLQLPWEIHQMLADGELSAGHARVLITADNPMQLAQMIVDDGLSVRQAEALAKDEDRPGGRQRSAKRENDPGDADTRALEKALGDTLGLVVKIKRRGERGDVRIAYKTLDQLDELCRRLQGET